MVGWKEPRTHVRIESPSLIQGNIHRIKSLDYVLGEYVNAHTFLLEQMSAAMEPVTLCFFFVFFWHDRQIFCNQQLFTIEIEGWYS